MSPRNSGFNFPFRAGSGHEAESQLKLKLYCNESAVGWLDLAGREAWRLEFERKPPIPLSPRLADAAGAVIDAPEVRDFFVNYLPESPHAERVARSFTPPPRNDAELLVALGQELAGAYALATNELEPVHYEPLTFARFEAQVAESRRSADAIAFAPHSPRLSLAGAQDKFALWFDREAADADARLKIPLGRAASTHIFKPSSTDSRFAMLPANEFACARLAQAVGLPVADTRIATYGDVRVLVVARFDRIKHNRVKPDTNVVRLHQNDLCQMLGVSRQRKYGSEAGIDTADLFEACRHTGVPALSRRALLRAWLFNFIIGNADAHAKNYSFLWQAETGRWTVAPFYDLLSVTPYLPSQPQSMGLLDEYRPGWFGPTHWRELARLAGVTPAYLAGEARQMAAAVRNVAPSLATELREQLLRDELEFLAERVNPLVHERCKCLLEI